MENEKFITLKAKWGKQQGKLILYPVQDRYTGELKGIEPYTEEEKRKLKRVVTQETNRTISDGMIINLNNETDKVDWEWMKQCLEIAGDYDACYNEPRALFYVENLDQDMDKRISVSELKFNAMSYVKQSSEAERSERCRLMGQDVRYFKSKEIYDWLMQQAESNPLKVIASYEDESAKTKLFLYRLLDHNIISKDINGMIKYGNIVLGVNEEGAVRWIQDPANRDLIVVFQQQLNPNLAFLGDDAKKAQSKAKASTKEPETETK